MLCNSSIRVSFYAQHVQLALLRESMRSNSSKMLLSAIAYINGRGIIPWGSFKRQILQKKSSYSYSSRWPHVPPGRPGVEMSHRTDLVSRSIIRNKSNQLLRGLAGRQPKFGLQTAGTSKLSVCDSFLYHPSVPCAALYWAWKWK